MALILAIEPDRRQANQVNAVVRGRLHAELVLADSAERALAALGTRVPDLILTSALLSPTDETKLGEHLRGLDGAAAHVQTLTIPVLASSRSGSDSEIGGMLGGVLRRGKSKSAATPEGCDPAVFAAQCAEYLERAQAERQAYTAAHPVEEPAPAVQPPRESAPAVAAPVETAQAAGRPSKSKKKEEPVEPLVINAPAAEATVQEAIARLAAFADIDETPVEPQSAVQDAAAEAVVAPPSDPLPQLASDDALPELDVTETFEETPAPVAAAPNVTPSEEPDVYDIGGFDVEAFAVAVQTTPDHRSNGKKQPAASAESAKTVPPASAAAKRDTPKAPAKPEAPKAPTKPEAPIAAAAPAAAAHLRHDAADKRIAASRPKPVQDEWGFFDPDQAGFAALLAKLEEIEDDEPARPASPQPNKKR